MIVKEIRLLIEKYNTIKSKGLIKTYDEANTCKDFILPLFSALGWDISNREEVTAQANASRGRVDYAFCIKGIPKFFLEAKSLKVDLNDTKWAEQTINYAWHKGVVWAVLTDFEAIKVFNAEWITKNPNESLFFEIRYDKYLENFDQLSLLSKQAFLENRLDKEAEKWGKKRRKIPVDEKLLSDILKWRNLLANNLRKNHPALQEDELDESIQRILDRLIFIRTCEDRNIEPITLAPLLREWLDSGRKQRLSQKLKTVFRDFDQGYNSQIFSPHLCEDLKINEEVLEIIINGLYETEDRSIRYDFSAIDADVLGSMYEQYLGHILKKTPTRATVKEKHLRRKEMGIYYTPKYIVDYIVKNTVGEVLKEKSYKDAMKLKILDPACGSGSFLIRAFEEMDNYLKEKRSQKGEEFAYFRRMEILNNNLYGVDLDKQAVEIAQLNLLLKALETRQKLPLIKNIRMGNSLISGDELTMYKYFGKNWKEKHPFNWQEQFPEVFKEGGFDVIIGNPPYVMVENLLADERRYLMDKYETAIKRFDIYIAFIEKGLKLLKEGGLLSFIIPYPFLNQNYAELIRKKIIDEYNIINIVDLSNVKVFGEAVVRNCIIVIKKKLVKRSSKIEIFRAVQTLKDVKPEISEYRSIETDFIRTTPKYMFRLDVDESAKQILSKIDGQSIKLGSICYVNWGARTGNIKKYVLNKVIDNQCKKMINARNIDRYSLKWSGEYIWYKKHELYNPMFEELFESNKIIIRDISGKARLKATFDDKKFYAEHTVSLCVPKHLLPRKIRGGTTFLLKEIEESKKYNLKYILALINSRLINFYFHLLLGGGLHVYPNDVKNLPIHNINFSNPQEKKMHDDLVKLVEKMLDLNKQIQNVSEKSDKWYSLKSEIEKTDNKIDEMVYKLYGITEKEKKIIEGEKSQK